MRRTQRRVERLAGEGLDWVTFASRVGDALREVVPFDRSCWHPVDPGTFLFTGSLGQNMVCSGQWLAHHEYVVDDVNKWHSLASDARKAASLREATGGDLSSSPRVRSSVEYGLPVGDELRASFVVDGTYWGAAGWIRAEGRPAFDTDEIDLLSALSPVIGDGFRRAILPTSSSATSAPDDEHGPGLVVLDPAGLVTSISPAAEHWIERLVEEPRGGPGESRIVQALAARARLPAGSPGGPDARPARARVRTRDGDWLLLYATPLSGEQTASVAVILQPAGPHEIAPLVARAYGLSERERQVTRLCLQGLSTKGIADALGITSYTVQDHLKSIFRKTGARSRAELVGLVFLEHYVPRFEGVDEVPSGWTAAESIVRRK